VSDSYSRFGKHLDAVRIYVKTEIQHRMKTFYLLIFNFFCFHGIAQNTPSIDSLMQYCHSAYRFNGVVMVANENKIIYQQAFGKANEQNDHNNQIDTKFRLGSLSKQFTAFIILKLIEKGFLSFNDHVGKFVKAFDQLDKRSITIRNLLTHTSGLADYTNLKTFNKQIYYKKDSIINMIAGAPVSFTPSSAFSYCNSNYFLLAVIIEKVTGKNFKDVLNEMVFKKAGMQNSGEDANDIVKNEATGHFYKKDSAVAAPYIEMKNTEGGGGMYSTAEDLLKWSLFFQRELAKDTLLKTAILPFSFPGGSQSIYSCGWCMMPGFIFHTGHINGFANLLAIDTVLHRTIMLLSNHDYKQLYITMQSVQHILQNKATAINCINNTPGNNLADYNGAYSIGDLTVNMKDTSNYLEGNAFGERKLLRWYNNDEFFFLNEEGIVKFERDKRGKVVALRSFQDYNWVELKKQ
jgi:CubicO group peptidase (beta-lactamase class C family)